MSTITTRAGKGSPLTNNEVDANFTNLNTDKAELSGAAFTGNITFTDNSKAIFGAGSDLQIYHSGSHSYIDEVGTGNLYVRSTKYRLANADGSKIYMTADDDTFVQLYDNNNAVKLATTSTGINITGNATFADNGKAIFGAGSDLQIYHDGSASYIADTGTGTLNIKASGSIRLRGNDTDELLARFNENGSNQFYYDNAEKLATTSTGIDVTGVITTDGMTTSGNVDFGDSDIARFGASNDLQIYHDGSNSYIEDAGIGNLIIRGTSLILEDAGGNDYIVMTDTGTGGTVEIKHNAVTKLATTATGIDVTGTVTMDVLDASGTGVHDLQRSHPTTTASLAVLDLKAKSTGDMAAGFGTAARFIIEDTANVENVVAEIAARRESSDLTAALTFTTLVRERMRIASNGDISFYEDTGTTPKFFWDASAESLGIGTSSPSAKLEVVTASPTQSRFAYNSTNYVEVNYDGFNVVGGSMVFENAGSEKMRIDSSGNVLVGTTSTAVSSSTGSVTGTVINSSGLFEAAKTGTIMELNRLSADGTILNFRKDGTTVGSIGSYLGAYAYIGSTSGTDTHIGFVNGSVRPATATGAALDATLDLGNSSGRFKDLYLSGGVKNSSSIYMGRTDLNTSVWVGNSTINAGDSSGAVRDAAVDLGYSSGRWKDAYLSGGVYLGGTGAANKLDDYEEGTWTPTFLYLTGVSSATGSYVKVGNLVTVSVAITSSGTTVITLNSSRISNLPFTVGTSGGGRYTGSFTDVNTSSGDYGIHTLSGTQAIFTSSVSTGNVIAGSFTYRAA